MKRLFLACKFVVLSVTLSAQHVENVVLITLDGLRWQEVFGGAADSMIDNKDMTPMHESIRIKFGADTREKARTKLMPWLWSTVAAEGQIYGNRWKDNRVDCSNDYWFSYPGYNEILTGFADKSIDSNAKNYNKNKTVLEWFNDKREFSGKVAAFGSWDVFPFIINDKRSGIPVNAGFRKAEDKYLTIEEQMLNELQDEIPSHWSTVRMDAFTHRYMINYMQKHHPRIVYISYGETDDFAHDGRYDHYLNSAHQTDRWIGELWDFLQDDPVYEGKTSIIITTDHGRGDSPMTTWKGHGNSIDGAGAIWIAALGPNISALGEMVEPGQLYQDQVAATLAALLGYNYENQRKVGESISSIVQKTEGAKD